MVKKYIIAAFVLASCAFLSCTSTEKGNADVQATESTEVTTDGFTPEVGKQYLNLSIANAEGDTVSFDEIVKNNKLTIIDCWASWCPPCCKEMPNMVSLYSKYHAKGLEIIGVSFDDKKDAWLGAVERMNMTWTQLSELNGWENQMMQYYGVEAIPSTFVIDQNGKIVAIDLLGDELEETVSDYLD